jgi:hypothetical protein
MEKIEHGNQKRIEVKILMKKNNLTRDKKEDIFSFMENFKKVTLEELQILSKRFSFPEVFKALLRNKYGSFKTMSEQTGIKQRQISRWASAPTIIESKFRNILIKEIGIDLFSPDVQDLFIDNETEKAQ